MATEYKFRCPSCSEEHWPGGLYEVFDRWVRENGAWKCPECDQPYEFYLTFPFAFGADGRVRMVDIFAPKSRCEWTDPQGHLIRYHPYLAIGETLDATPKRTAWLPYWHADVEDGGRTKMKFGQWAPHMDLHLFAELVDQAREHGYLV